MLYIFIVKKMSYFKFNCDLYYYKNICEKLKKKINVNL